MTIAPKYVLLAVVSLILARPTLADERLDLFERQIRPVLAAHCYECHGPAKSESNLRVDHISFLKVEGEYGPVLVPGKPLESSLFLSLTHAREELMMPLDRDKLAGTIIADFKQWIEDGAVWPDEQPASGPAEQFDLQARISRLPWIWQTPSSHSIPIVKRQDWPSSDIDRFILAKLEVSGMAPAVDAEPEVWLRRVFFAITGLPPRPQQIHEFLNDPSEQRRELIVDQLLQSPHYGERWARHWMDLVRYAESRGHESDFAIANAWHYRDYLIRAFNDDVPYDQFVIEHLAGDLLQSPRINRERGFNESILATAWPFFGEEVHSPVDIRQDECDRIDNKIDVFSKTFLGLTVACARCHDHKFDAISQQDYYSLAGFILSSHFRQVRFESMQQNGAIARQLEAQNQSLQRELAAEIASELRPFVSQTAKQILAPKRKSDGELSDDDASEFGAVEAEAWATQIELAASDVTHPLHALYRGESTIRGEQAASNAQESGSQQLIVDYSDPHQPWLAAGYAFGLAARRVGDLTIPEDSSKPVGNVLLAGMARRDPIWNSLKVREGNEPDSGSLNAVGRSAGLISTPTFILEDGRVHVLMRGESQLYAAVDSHLMITGPLHRRLVDTLNVPEKKWVTLDLRDYQGHRLHLEFGPVGQAPLSVWKVIEGRPVDESVTQNATLGLRDDFTVAAVSAQKYLLETLDAFAARTFSTMEDAVARARAVDWLLNTPELFPISSESRQRQQVVIDRYLAGRANAAERIQPASRTAIALMDGSGVDEYILRRGNYQEPGDSAPRQLPAAFAAPSLAEEKGSGRLQLAEQLVDANNPLVARVMVNRIWHHLMGRGIVRSVDNFGWLGDRPTHPRLLDHLAVQFVHDDDWSIKQTIKRIVLSRTYAMSSRPDDRRAEELDPDNELLHRMNVRRLEAEAIRDNLLAVSGRLDCTLYGEPIPVHLTEFVIGRGRPDASGPLDGAGRRSIYTEVRRNFLPTMMLTFDMPIPFSAVGSRNVTNVPAQSLALMNDTLIYEQAKVWAARIAKELPDASDGQRIERMYWEAFGRRVLPAETESALRTIDLLATHHGIEKSDIKVWSDLCHTMFRLNEFIYLR